MAKYVKCPRCELNYILENEGYCKVCKAELKLEGYTLLEEDETELLCPICKTNILDDGEKICPDCKMKKVKTPTDAKEESMVVNVREDVLVADGGDFIDDEKVGENIETELIDAGFFEVPVEEELGIEVPVPEKDGDDELDGEDEEFKGVDDDDLDYVGADELDEMELDEDDEAVDNDEE